MCRPGRSYRRFPAQDIDAAWVKKSRTVLLVPGPTGWPTSDERFSLLEDEGGEGGVFVIRAAWR